MNLIDNCWKKSKKKPVRQSILSTIVREEEGGQNVLKRFLRGQLLEGNNSKSHFLTPSSSCNNVHKVVYNNFWQHCNSTKLCNTPAAAPFLWDVLHASLKGSQQKTQLNSRCCKIISFSSHWPVVAWCC